MESGAQPGNSNPTKGKEWTNALKRALSRYGDSDFRKGLDKLADRVVKAAAEGDENAFLKAAEVVGDRLEGKAKQSVDVGLSDDENNPIHALLKASTELKTKLRK